MRVSPDQFGEGIDGIGLLVMTDGKLDYPHGVPIGGYLLSVSSQLGDEPGECRWPPRD